jgi:glycosyltransferase involved in cell wall biosynthesis
VAERTLLVVSRIPFDHGGSGNVRWQHLRRALPRHGWRVVECSPAGEPADDVWATRRARVMEVAGRLLNPLARALRVHPVALAPNNLWALTGRRAVRAAIAQSHPDVVLATAPPPSALLAAAAAEHLPLVAELRDLWAGNPFYDRGGPLLRRLEGRVFARASAVVTVTDACRDALLGLHPEIGPRLEVIPNGFDPQLLARRSSPPVGSVSTLVHTGTLYGDRTAEALIAALGRPELRGRVRLELVGFVDPRTRRAIASASGVDVTARPSVAWEEAIERVRESDFAVVINTPGTGGELALPNKLFEALALGRPVLALTGAESETARLLQRLGQDAGIASPDDPAAIASALQRLLGDPPPPVRKEALAEFDRNRIAGSYAALLHSVATRSRSSTVRCSTTSLR